MFERDFSTMSNQRPKICVCGSINMDLVVSTPRLPEPGETIMAHSLREVPGGKGANQAVAASRLTAQVTMIGRVGNDGFGNTLKDQLMAHQVDVGGIRTTDGASGTAIVSVDDQGENSIVVIPGANGCVSTADIDDSEALIRNADCLLLQLEIPMATVVHAIHMGRKHRKLVLLNPAPMPTTLDLRLFQVDVFCPNKTEAEMLLGTQIASVDDGLLAASKLQSQGPRVVIITLGSEGAVMCDELGAQWIAPFAIQAVDTTAAGDAFMGALAYKLCQSATFKDAATFASAAGAYAATRSGAQPSLPSLEDVASILKQRL
jgi:ribokinase